MIADETPLVDNHCHGLLVHDLQPDEFRLLATESDWLSLPGVETLDSPFGLGIRSRCAPLLDLEPHVAIDRYLERRAELGAAEVNARLMAATGTGALVIDTGFTSSPVLGVEAMASVTGMEAYEIVRLEPIAEAVAETASAASFAGDFRSALASAATRAVGFKTIIAYRTGFDLPEQPYSDAEVERAAGEWLAECETLGRYRLDHPVLLAFVIWEAVRHRKPIQFHVGFGDSDVSLHRSDPTLLTRFFTATRETGASFMLLHCYPYVREAGSLGHIFPHVYLDAGLVSHYMGPSALASVRHTLEIAPFHKVLYSSDAYGLAEHYLVSATSWRRSIATIIDEWLQDDWLSAADADRIVGLVAGGNARRVYGLGDA